ncbi:hypothetical protein [Idiomarina abyssalis]|uniref:hypothetical protein n=1 Tax=Idiomarina abyssalis TaxID=86102 RepID=UPI001CD20C6A|nr:hypothetical protein [Idiomarina abyssalis]
MILSVGGWYVGNSAVIEWLDGFDDYKLLKGDLHELRNPGYLFDYISSCNVMHKSKFFINIFIFSLKGILRSLIAHSLRKKIGSLKKYNLSYHLKILILLILSLPILFSYSLQVKLWRKLFVNRKYQYILQNPIFYDDIRPEHSKLWREIFNNSKILVVTRSPIEQFIDISLHNEFHDRKSPFRQGTEGMSSIEKFETIVLRTYEQRINLAKEFGNKVVCVVSFEKFVNQDENEINRLRSFFAIVGEKRNSAFEFSKSKKNACLSKSHRDIADDILSKPLTIENINKKIHELRKVSG